MLGYNKFTESLKKDKLYSRVSYEEFNKKVDLCGSTNFTKNEIYLIKNNIKDEYSFSLPIKSMVVLSNRKINNFICVSKLNDEWYVCAIQEIINDFFDDPSDKIDEYFLCDGFDGLLQFIGENIE